MMRVLIGGGGTGGHTFPGIAIAEEILHRDRDSQITFIASNRDADRNILSEVAFPVVHLDIPRRIRTVFNLLPFLYKWFRGFVTTARVIREFSPHAVVGVGGYVALLPIILAWWHKIPVTLVEQNIIPGRANKRMLRLASKMCLSFEESLSYFHRFLDRLIVTGNPVRKGVFEIEGGNAIDGLGEKCLTILVIGGSQGSQFINETMPKVCGILKTKKLEFQVFHLAGDKEQDFPLQ